MLRKKALKLHTSSKSITPSTSSQRVSNRGPGIQIFEGIGAIYIQATIGGGKQSPHRHKQKRQHSQQKQVCHSRTCIMNQFYC